MNPENVNPKNFKQKHILYNQNDFSIAYGIWVDGEKVVAMRWANYPNDRHGQPIWFKVSEKLTKTFLIALLNKDELSDNEKTNVVKSLEEIL